MSHWEWTALLNLVVAAAYLVISATIVRGLVHTKQMSRLRANRLALATVGIFVTCAVHHGHHGLALVIDDGLGNQQGLRVASGGWFDAAFDAFTGLVGLAYLMFRRSTGIPVRVPAMFDIASQATARQLAAHPPRARGFENKLNTVLIESDPYLGPLYPPPVLEGRPMTVVMPAVPLPVERTRRFAHEGNSSAFDDTRPTGVQSDLIHARPVVDEKVMAMGSLLQFGEIIDERQIQARLVRAQAFNDALLSASPDITTINDLDTGLTTWASRSVAEMLGWSDATSPPTGELDLLLLVAPEDHGRLLAANSAVALLADGETLSVRLRFRSRDGRDRWISRHTNPFGRDTDGEVHQGLSVVREITDVVATEAQVKHAALHDPLTGLPNRILLMDRVASALDRADRENGGVVVLFCGVDGFKRVNDTAGHAAGDAVLIEVADRIRRALPRCDSVGRVGGDEFVIVLEPGHAISVDQKAPGATESTSWVDEPSQSARVNLDPTAIAELVAEKIRLVVAEPIVHEGSAFDVSLSIGMTIAKPGSIAEDVLRDADAAIHLAKHRGKNRLEIFDDALRINNDERLRVDSALRMALVPGGPAHPMLSVVYQPVLDLDHGRLIGFEALARLTDSLGHPIPPDFFIPIAEETGLISLLGEAILDAALAGFARWRAEHADAQRAVIHVNLSAHQVQQADMPTIVRSALQRHGLAPADLILELTESILLQAGSSGLQQLTELHRSGVGIAIDDFGTGYASLRYLAILPITAVKVDRSFTSAMLTDPISATILRAIAGLSAEMGLSCIVEGIETHEQLAALPAGLLGQGYLLGRPTPDLRNDWPLTVVTGPPAAPTETSRHLESIG